MVSVPGLTAGLSDGILILKLSKPRQKNPISAEVYHALADNLLKNASNPDCRVAVITGSGDYYSSGNDLTNFSKMMSNLPPDSGDNPMAAAAEIGRKMLSDFQQAIIEFPKPLIALVNGPAIGIAVTTLLLCDAVLASDKATFSTPFTNLAQSPEGCSTLTFPLAMGPLMASDVLLFNRVLTAQEAFHFGLISRIIPYESFESETTAFVKRVASLPTGSVQASKKLLRGRYQSLSRERLLEVSREECQVLKELWQSDECISAIGNFLSRKSSSKL